MILKQSNIKVKETETESENEDLSDCESSFNIPSEMDYYDIETMFELIDSGQILITNQKTIEIFNQLRVDNQLMNEQMNTEIIEAVYLQFRLSVAKTSCCNSYICYINFAH